MSKVDWTQVAVFGIVALVVFMIGASLLSAYGSWGRMPGWGMMGPGMMGSWGYGSFGWLGMIFMLLFPLGFLILMVLGVIWLVKAAAQPSEQTPVTPGGTCPNCGRAVQTDWQLCPYCRQELR